MNGKMTSAMPIVYPESDGQPMADNTKQFRWIVTIQGGIDALFVDQPDVFVAGDLLWYPVEGRPDIRVAPDVLVAFGRPKGDRGSYLQWKEQNIPPQVVFEVMSPNNTVAEMKRKLAFYEKYGVEEYYLYDPDRGSILAWQRKDDLLVTIDAHGWVSPRLGVRFELHGEDLELYRPDGDRFVHYVDAILTHVRERKALRQEHLRAEQEYLRAEQESRRAEQESRRAEQEHQRVERMAAKLRALGIDPENDIP